MLPQGTTGAPLGQPEPGAEVIDANTAASGVQSFPFAASARIGLSGVRSKAAFLSRSFSFWRRSGSHAGTLLAPVITGSLSCTNFADHIHACRTLSDKCLNLPQLGDNLFSLAPSRSLSGPPAS